jgi:hypothetical protein
MGTGIAQSLQIALGYGLDDRGSIPGKGWESFSSPASRRRLGPTQPPIQCLLGVLSSGVKRPMREADHSSQSSAEVNA